MTGQFIAFEGQEGSGKTTLINSLKVQLITEGREVVVVQQPGGTEYGNRLRNILTEFDDDITPAAAFFAHMSQRFEALEKVILPSLERGATVLADRFEASAFAYQVYYAQDENLLKVFRVVHRQVYEMLAPYTYTCVLLKIDPLTAHCRAVGQKRKLSTFDKKSREYYKTIDDGYGYVRKHMHPDIAWHTFFGTPEPSQLRTVIFKQLFQEAGNL